MIPGGTAGLTPAAFTRKRPVSGRTLGFGVFGRHFFFKSTVGSLCAVGFSAWWRTDGTPEQ